MSEASHQPLFQAPRIWADPEHLEIVIRFQNQHIGSFQVVSDRFRHMSNVRELSDSNAVGKNAECQGLCRIVRNGERCNVRIADSKCDASGNWRESGSLALEFFRSNFQERPSTEEDL